MCTIAQIILLARKAHVKINSHVDRVGNVRSPKSADRESHCDMQVIDKIEIIRLSDFALPLLFRLRNNLY